MTLKNTPKIFWLGQQIFDHAGKLAPPNHFKNLKVDPFRGFEEYQEKSLPPELKQFCRHD